MNSSPIPRVEPPTARASISAIVSGAALFSKRRSSLPIAAVITPVRCRIPNTPPTTKMKKMMPACFSRPRGMAVR